MLLTLINALLSSSDSHNTDVSPANKSYVGTIFIQISENKPLPTVPPTIIHILWIHFPLIVATNALVISAVYYVKELYTPSNIIIAGLAIVDSLTGVVTLPLLWMIDNPDPDIKILVRGTKTACLFTIFASFIPPRVALKYIFLTSLERFFAIKFPIKYRISSNLRKVVIIMALIIVLDGIELIIVILFYLNRNIWINGRSKSENVEQCHPNQIFPKAYDLFLIGHTVILVITSLSLNLFVGHYAWKQIKDRHASITSNQLKKHHSKTYHEIKLKESQLTQLKISLSLMCIYLIFWSPLIVYGVFVKIIKSLNLMKAITFHCILANSWINAIVYSILKNTYRRAFFFFLTNYPCKWCKVNAFLNREKDTMTNYTSSNTMKLKQKSSMILNKALSANRQLDTNEQLE